MEEKGKKKRKKKWRKYENKENTLIRLFKKEEDNKRGETQLKNK